MPIARVQGPDGKTYKIEVPQGASEQDILSFAQSQFGKTEQTQPELKQGILPRLAAGALAVGQGAMPVFDEAGAFLGEKLGVGGDISYEDRLKNIRGTEQAFTSEYPKTDVGLRLAGAVGSTLPAAGAMAARPILAGATYGGLQGFTGAEGGGASRVLSGAAGAGLGAAGGYAADKLLTPAAAWIGEKAGALSKPSMNLQGRELANIEKNLGLAGITKEQYAANLLRSSPDDFAGELGGEALRMQTQSQAKLTGPAMQAAREAMRQRLETAPTRTKKIIEDILGGSDDLTDKLATIEQLKLVEPDLYAAVTGSIPKRVIGDVISTPAGREAVPQALENIANREMAPSVRSQLPSDVPLGTAHEIAKALGDKVARNPLTGAMTDPASGAPIESLRASMVNKLRQASPEFDLAQTAAAERRSFEEAMSRGRKLAKMTTGETADDVLAAGIRKEEVTPYMTAGFKQGLLDSIENVPLGTGNPISRLATQKTVNRIGELVGEPKAQEFAQKAMAEKLRMELANRALMGSNTAETLSSGLSSIPLSKAGMIDKTLGVLDDLINSKSNERLAEALYATSPEQKKDLIAALLGKNAQAYVPEEARRNMMIEMLRGSIGSIPAQVGGSIANIPNVRIYKKAGE